MTKLGFKRGQGPKTKKAKKERSLTAYKTDAWDAFSMFIRTRDCLITTGDTEWGACITCGELFPRSARKGLQAGHFICGRRNSQLFNEKGVHAQCPSCNKGEEGNPIVYNAVMAKFYDDDTIWAIRREKNDIIKFSIDECKAIRKKYQDELVRLTTVGLNDEELRLKSVYESNDCFRDIYSKVK